MSNEKKVNLFELEPKPRDYSKPVPPEVTKSFKNFGKEYFHSNYHHGYDDYQYDGSYQKPAENLVEFFELTPGDRVLSLGCAKGFLLHDLLLAEPELEVFGLDVSHFALTHAMNSVQNRLVQASSARVPFTSDSFDLTTCVNVFPNLSEKQCRATLREMNRVSKRHKFIQIPTFRNNQEKHNYENWVPVKKNKISVEGWKQIFEEEDYDGHYYWFLFHEIENE